MKYSKHFGKPHKSKEELAARIDRKLRDMRLHAGKDQFDPVEMMAIIGAEAYRDKDLPMALVAFKEVAAYVRPKLAPKQVEEQQDPGTAVSKARVLDAFSRMGVRIETQDPQAIAEELMVTEGLSWDQAVERVEQMTGVPIIDAVAIPALPRLDDVD